MKVFRVCVEVELVVAAETEEEAERYCYNSSDWHEEARQGVVTATEIRARAEIPKGWEGSLPWNGKGDATVESYLPALTCEGCVHLLTISVSTDEGPFKEERYSCLRLGDLIAHPLHPLRHPECMARNLFRGLLASKPAT